MKFIVINASPKTKHSITLQHLLYIEKQHPEHQFEYIHIANKIPVYEKKEALFNSVIQKINESDAIIWSFPVYYALVPSQLKRFIELIFERCPNTPFKGKYTTSFTTSINFFDHTAHNYMQGVCESLGFNYVDSYSAHMNDFFKSEEREKMKNFFKWFTEFIDRRIPTQKKYNILNPDLVSYQPDIEAIPAITEPISTSKVLLLTDERSGDTNLTNMTQVLTHLLGMTVEKKNIYQINLKNGCLGCCTCGYDNVCVQKDGFTQFFNENVKTADVIIIAGSIKDHYLSAQWKKFFDRSFFNGHAPVLKGKRIGFVISGNLSQLQNLREKTQPPINVPERSDI